MRLQVSLGTFRHAEYVTACGWVGNELFTCSDDKTVHKVNSEGESAGIVANLDSYPTDLHWFPSGNKRQQSDLFVLACSDGMYLLILRNGRIEKKVDAHKGAVICVRWSNEGTAIATAGEDGLVKIWSRSGMLRSALAQLDSSVYSISWSPDSNSLCFTSGKDIVVKPLQPQAKQITWRAHDGIVLHVDWNVVNSLIVSGGEDRRYKVWDAFGRPLFQSRPLEFSITAVAWSPSGELFAVSMFDSIRLCDRTGWAYSREQVNTGSISCIAWSSDGTQLAGAGANGSVLFGQVLERRAEWQNIEVLLKESHKVLVNDILTEMEEELDFRDRVVNMAVGYGHLVVTTSLQCCIYSLQNLNTPHIFDLKETVHFLMLGEKNYLMADMNGLQVYSYEGRPVAAPKFPGMRPEAFNGQTVSVSGDSLAIIDHSDNKMIRVMDLQTGKEVGKPVQHALEVVSVGLNRWAGTAAKERKCVFQDKNRDLYICPVGQGAVGKEVLPIKLGTMCDSAMWSADTDMLAAVMDGKLVVWYYPNVVFVDRDLASQTKYTRDASDFGKDSQIVQFHGTSVAVRRADGAVLYAAVSPYPAQLYAVVCRFQWEMAISLCRYVKDPTLWAVLAAMALAEKELSTAEVAFAAIDEVAKLQYVLFIKEIPTPEGRNAELAMWRRRPEEAESILLQAGLIYRAIDVRIRLFHWDRALELAVHHKTHVDTVLGFRERFLAAMGREETLERFKQYREGVQIDWDKITAKIQQEVEKEKERPTAKPYQE